ncbi:EAL domain-containing protein [Daeguia caeni]|uniref:cyclic-guanylate-specific phosphodiesterase n=1 Tax=Daeguia caeni TaxID=439612 RepID=A0ABV9H7M2_9HYPH
MRLDHITAKYLVPFIMLVFLFAGAAVGKWSGIKFQRIETERQANSYITALSSYAAKLIASARETLAAANNSPYPVCSAEDIAYLRQLVYHGYHIKDIARLSGDRMVCSTYLDVLPRQMPRPMANVERADGTYFYSEGPLSDSAMFGSVMGQGNASVVLTPAAFDLMHTPDYAFAIFLMDHESGQYARIHSHPNTDTLRPPGNGTSETLWSEEGTILKGVCNQQTRICVSIGGTRIPDNWMVQLEDFFATTLGLLAGGGFGLGWLYYSNRQRPLGVRLMTALAEHRLNVVYQPLINFQSGKLVGFEALIRWQTNEGDVIPPDVFIPLAENNGQAWRVAIYVLEQVVEDMGSILRRRRDLHVNINIVADDLQNEKFLSALSYLLERANIQPQQIGLELTERTPVDFEKAGDAIVKLHARGHRIYIDDFGIGYSSLAYLGTLDIDAIKIDKSFTRTVSLSENAISIVPQIISMAHEFGLDIIVEGVETEEQAEYFRKLGIDIVGQGWYLGMPMSAVHARSLAAPSKSKFPGPLNL